MCLHKSADLDGALLPPICLTSQWNPAQLLRAISPHLMMIADDSVMGAPCCSFPATNDVRIWELMLSAPHNLMMMTGEYGECG